MTHKPIPPEPGDLFEVPYPFIRATFSEFDGEGVAESLTWQPGARFATDSPNLNFGPTADGVGAQLLTVVSRHKPGKFPERVFYTRQWRDPDGKIFGKTCCRVTTMACWRALINGYRHPFEMANALALSTPPGAGTSETSQ